ncbi:FG-GAP-like repeat-containing protein [Halobacteriovorax sp. HLS]|uniref:FG-GAP-like repeat-containing protein n=1 Tax=Halobacteriovorax sp. HLS TaxID=2234000 RepID=UPI000FDA9978|nr:FG-GAP-like repeat-containing protein [Halobacteriovorax sp. HLS]
MNYLNKLLIFHAIFLLLSSCGKTPEASAPLSTAPAASTQWLLDQSSGKVKLVSPADDRSSFFGQSIAVGDFNNDGKNDLAVGAPNGDYSVLGSVGQTDTGGVFIYNSIQDGTDFSVADKMISANTNTNNLFGNALFAFDINRDGYSDLLVGAPTEDRVGANTGSIYIYYGSANGLNSSPSQILDHPTNTVNEGFGTTIRVADLDKDGYYEIIASAKYADTPSTNAGGFWIIPGTSNILYSTASALRVDMPAALVSASDECGHGLETGDYNGDGLLDIYLGCPYEDTGGSNAGAVFVYYGNGVNGTWVVSNTTPSANIYNPVPTANDNFGESILSADYNADSKIDLIIGAVRADDSFADSGALYLYSDIQTNATVDSVVGPPYTSVSAEYFGSSLTLADVTGDSYPDLLVGAILSRTEGYSGGSVSVLARTYWGGIDFTARSKKITYDYHTSPTLKKLNANGSFGSSVCHGDMNNDGMDDLIVGAYLDDSNFTDNGSIYIYYKRTGGEIYQRPDVKIRADSATVSTTGLGHSCIVYDYNRDGYKDLLVGAINDDTSGANAGRVNIYLGSSSGVSHSPNLTVLGPATTNYGFGSSLSVGDIDNDGFDDLIVGAHLDDSTAVNQGAIYIFRSNSTTGIVDLNSYTRFHNPAGATLDYYGFSVLAFDYDRDGDKDLLIGSPGNDTTAAGTGIVHVMLNGTNGANAGVNTLLDTTIDSNITAPTALANVGFGSALHGGLYYSSSYPDLFVGSYLDDIGGTDAGNIWIYKGKSTGVEVSPYSTGTFDAPSYDHGEWLGYSITTFDFNNDGSQDLIMGAAADDDIGYNSGSVYIQIEKLP